MEMHSPYDDKLFKGAMPKMFGAARDLRKATTEAEDLLWQQLRNRKLAGLKFRRQHPVKNFVADFYCNEKELVIEVDGDVHNNENAKGYDEARTKELNDLGLQVLRFTNAEVERSMSLVLDQILTHVNREMNQKR